MGIRSAFLFSLVIGVFLIIAAVASFGFNQFLVSEAVSENTAADSLYAEGMQLVLLTNEVLLYGQSRAVTQWRNQFNKALNLSANKDGFDGDAIAKSVVAIHANLTDMRPLFEGLVTSGMVGPGRQAAEVGDILSSQLFRKLVQLQGALRILNSASETMLLEVYAGSKRRMLITFGIFASLITIFGIGVSVKFGRFVLKPIQKLSETISMINTGKLEERAPVFSSDEIGVVCHAFNGLLDQQARHQDELQYMAYHDALTGLPNQLLVADRLERSIAYADRAGAKVALLFLDLDDFKTINDSLGHPVGDGLLREVAARLIICLRDTDTVGRKGGDEFIILLSDVHDADDITTSAHKLLEAIALPMTLDNHQLSITASIGIAIFPDDSDDFNILLKKADTALYQAKAAGRNAYRFFTDEMNITSSEYLELRAGLHRALENEEFVLHYQPQVRLLDNAIIGVEALIRWHHPTRGLVRPGSFIPVAEDSGLIVSIGQWVLREACRQTAEWRKAGLPALVMAINLSPVQFRRGDLEETLVEAIKEAGIPPEYLELELTESILISDTEETLATVQRLKLIGLSLAIDDFGTGYSSFSYLRRFNVNKLKIDRSFVSGLATNQEDAAIVQAIIKLAHILGLRTVAEGVEDQETMDLLRIHECDEAQGYYLARPMSAEDFERYLMRKVDV